MTRGPAPERIRLVVLYGGVSAEHEVSCVSAAHVVAAADPDRYDVVGVGIGRDGVWHAPDTVGRLHGVGRSERLEVAGPEVEPVTFLTGEPGRTVVFPLVHGTRGEDGTLQGLLESCGVPYVGSGVLGSAVCMDKAMAKTLTAAAGIPQARWVTTTVGPADDTVTLTHRVQDLLDDAAIGTPVFVKPANMGSSVGITKAHDAGELGTALALAASYDERIVVEETVVGREIEVAVLGNSIADHPPRASVPGEIAPGAEFYDYADKYADGTARLTIPAALDDAESERVRSLAVDAYLALRCDGLARVDFFFEPGGRGFLLNEINTLPGFTPISMYPKLWEATGLAYTSLIDELVDLARARHTRRSGFRIDA